MSRIARWAAWLAPYFLAIFVTILILWGLRVWWVAPLERDCIAQGGHRVHHVSAFLCVDNDGRIIEIEHP